MNPAWENRNGAGAHGQDTTNGTGSPRELHELPELDNTLRVIATVPVPEGLVERVHVTLRTAPRGARVLAWPTALRPQAAWLGAGWARTAAAAAIVFVVAGGGWGVYMRLPHSQKVVVMPAAQKAGGFSSAGAIHTPDSIQGTVITNPLIAKPSAHHKTHPGKLKTKNAETTNPVTPDAASTATPVAVPAQR
jgi:hypothetical protein